MVAIASDLPIPPLARVPAAPQQLSPTRPVADVFEACSGLLSANDASRTELQTLSRAGTLLCRQALGQLHRGALADAEAKMSESSDLGRDVFVGEEPVAAQLERARLTGGWTEAWVAAACFDSWLRTGVLSAPMPANLASGVTELDDEKWLAGFIGSVRTLERYAVLRAESLDADSVSYALDTAQAAEAALMQFEFRNTGDLRRCGTPSVGNQKIHIPTCPPRRPHSRIAPRTRALAAQNRTELNTNLFQYQDSLVFSSLRVQYFPVNLYPVEMDSSPPPPLATTRSPCSNRSFDGVKYTAKRIEEVLYEVRMAHLRTAYDNVPTSSAQPPTTSAESSVDASAAGGASEGDAVGEAVARVVESHALDAVHERYQRHDALREDVIKRCREPQKVSA